MEAMRFDCRCDTYHSMHPAPRQNMLSSTRMVRSCSKRTPRATVRTTARCRLSLPRESMADFISSLFYAQEMSLHASSIHDQAMVGIDHTPYFPNEGLAV